MKNNIDLLGIVRNTSMLNAPAGSCHELINLRKKYGSWKPILPKHAIKTNFPPSDEMFIHTMDSVEYFINYNTDGTIKALTSAGEEVETLITIASGQDIKFYSLGYFLIITNSTDYTKYIFRCDVDADTKYLNVSDLPFLNLTITSEEQTGLSQEYSANPDNESFQAGWWVLDSEFRELYPEYFEGFVFVRWAIEMIDGTLLKHSLPVFIYNGEITTTDESDHALINTILYRLKYTLPATLPSDWSNYKNLIRGITVFMTKPISKYNIESSGYTEGGSFIGLIEKSNLVIDLFRNENAYYKVHHIPFNKIIATETGLIGYGKPVDAPGIRRSINAASSATGISGTSSYSDHRTRSSNLSLTPGGLVKAIVPEYNPAALNINDITAYDLLNVDDVSHHKIFGSTALNYNSRLFFADIYTKFFTGYNISDIIQTSGGTITAFNLYLEVDIETDNKTLTVQQSMQSTKDSIIIPYIIGYPDIRATELRILHNSGGTVKVLTFSLESHPLLNISTANKMGSADLDEQAIDSNGYQTITIASIDTGGTLADVDDSLMDKNRIQLTELYNPFLLPAIHSYQVGEGVILKLAVNMMALDDQFGAFPVFVFSSRGIWALNLSDSGSVVISNIVPVSSSVCINADSVIVVDNLLVFLASDGIKLLTGQTPGEISDIAEGPVLSPLDGNSNYDEILVQTLLNNVSNQISSVDILTYAEDAVFGYDKNHREIIVSNFNYAYSYAYSLEEKIWYKLSQKFKKFINNFPNTYAISSGNDIVDISEEDETGNVKVFLESRPIVLDDYINIKIQRLILGCSLDIQTSRYAALYLFGSNDGKYWQLITGKEVTVSDPLATAGDNVNNIILVRPFISLKFIILVFTGSIKQGSSISNISIIV